MMYFVFFFIIKSVLARTIDISCGTVPMMQWNNQSSRRTTPLTLPVDLVIVQHTVTPECSTDDACEDIARRIQSYHVNNMHWTDIGQSFLVGGNGKIYEGSGWKVGAHTLGYNNKSISITFIGDFRKRSPATSAIQSARDFLKCAARLEYLTGDYTLIAHSQVSNTESPGAILSHKIRSWPHWIEDFSDL